LVFGRWSLARDRALKRKERDQRYLRVTRYFNTSARFGLNLQARMLEAESSILVSSAHLLAVARKPL